MEVFILIRLPSKLRKMCDVIIMQSLWASLFNGPHNQEVDAEARKHFGRML